MASLRVSVSPLALREKGDDTSLLISNYFRSLSVLLSCWPKSALLDALSVSDANISKTNDLKKQTAFALRTNSRLLVRAKSATI